MSALAAAGTFTRREKLLILTGLLSSMFLAALDQTIIATALPQIAADLKGTTPLSWIVAGYMVTATAVTAIYGKLSDLYGRRPLLLTAVTVFLIGSLLCGFAYSMRMLVVFRAIQGLGGGGIFSVAQTTIADIMSPRERGRYQAHFAAVFSFASIGGPVLGGVFAEHFGWQWIFWINLPIGLVALLITERQLRRLGAKKIRHKIDFLGAILLAAAISGVLLYVTLLGDGEAWTSSRMIGLALLSCLLTLLTIAWERRVAEPIIPSFLFVNPVARVALASGFLTSGVMIGTSIFMPILFEFCYGLSAENAGLMMIPLGGATVLGAMVCGRFIAKTGRYKTIPLIGSLLYGAALFILSLSGLRSPLPVIGGEMFVLSFGIGLCLPVLHVAVQNAVDPHHLGSATSTVNLFRSMGGSFGVTLFGVLIVTLMNGGLLAGPGAGAGGPLPDFVRSGSNPAGMLLHAGVSLFNELGAPIQSALRSIVHHSFAVVFRLYAGIAILNFLALLYLPEWPLRMENGIEARLAAEPGE